MSVAGEEIKKVSRFGRVRMDIRNIVLDRDGPCPTIESMEFSVRLEGGH